MYLLCFNALRVLHRIKTGRRRRSVSVYPSNWLGHTMTQPTYRGTCAQDGAGRLECAI